jgi:SAM-dependent methyltransferase
MAIETLEIFEPKSMRYSIAEQNERYRRLRELGRAVDHAGGSFDDFDLRSFLDETLAGLTFSTSPPSALEYGTGTGPGACFLSACGFRVDAIDIAPAAIELARQFAAERGLTIHFEVRDICVYRPADKQYDLVVDSFCLQRLVADEQRQQALAAVQTLLKPNGYFIIGTTIYRAGRQLPADEGCDESTGIVYRKLPPNTGDYEDLVVRAGELVYPRVRRVRPEALRGELEMAGFRVLRQDGGCVLCEIAKEQC